MSDADPSRSSQPPSSPSPLLAGTQAWAALIDAVGPASMLVAIEGRLGAQLRERVQAEDIWQETLMHAWRDRAQCQWTDARGFRRWLLGIVDHRIGDARDFHGAARRSMDREQPLSRPNSQGDTWHGEPSGSTTPSRLAVQREQADQMLDALQAVPAEMREVLRLRLFEGQTIVEIASRLGIGESAAKHRYRKGALLYRQHLHQRLATGSDRES